MKITVYICIFLINLGIFGVPIYRSIVRINNLNSEMRNIAMEEKIAKEKIIEYGKRLSQIENPFYREKIARDRLQMKKEGEIIYRSIDITQEEK
ncbi:Septum formation initiator [Cetobacterium ceti]|uniref:Septum formation initiator n=1 Tax=Cetobacterium ceti TaxID=180163 RepID=A0A1T4KPV0_9FUSO|nr:septum formation initiator family protein [Cetobacterium ceti]SJZ44431.1 Septum formation initiator [Cetobacterium ceti]